MQKDRLQALALALVLLAAHRGAAAEEPRDRYWAELSYFYPSISSTARLDFPRTNVPGTVISLEDDLGLTNRTGTPYVLLGVRLGERWRVEFEYYTLKRTAPTDVDRQINWGEIQFPASAHVDSAFNSTIYRLSGGYSFHKSTDAEAGATFGLHMTDFRLELSGEGNGPSGSGQLSERRDQFVPLPTLGLYGTFMLANHWWVRGRLDYMSLKYDQHDGSLVNWMAAVDWRFAQNWGAGLGYRFVDYKLASSASKLHGLVNYRFKGPAFFVNAAF